ncbi:MAG TPA: beta-propeller fold lactonase family protein [Acidobacteriaceae bacterium]
MTQVQRRAVRGTAVVAGLMLATSLVGCGNFFVCQKASCTTGGGGSTGPAGNVAYVGNNVSAITSINGYTLAKPTLTAATNSPYAIGVAPAAMAVSRNNGFLYVASALTTAAPVAGIYGFTVGSGGALSVLNGGFAMVSLSSVAAMDVSPDGNWLVVATANDTTAASPVTITAYGLNATSGLITSGTPLPYGPPTGSIVSALKVAPSGDFISVALGTGGVYTFPFTTSTGAIGVTPALTTFSSGGAYDVAIDSNNYLYIAATGNIFVYGVSTVGVPNQSPVSTTGTPTAAGGPFSIALDGTSYVYASASTTSSNLIYAFSTKNGVLSALSTATIAAPATTTKLAVDSTGAYLFAAGYDSSAGLKMYGITSGTGVLTSLDTAATGTTVAVPTSLTLSH